MSTHSPVSVPAPAKLLPKPEVMYRALVERDASYDGAFIIGVKTTGIFCRPICTARKPKPGNVEYFGSPGDALHAGYRPCKRCRPLEAPGAPSELVETLARRADAAGPRGERLRDADLRAMGVDPSTARRAFQRHYKMTFHAYARARRLGSALGAIRAGRTVTAAASAGGYSSGSGFREAFTRLFGDAPARSKGADCMLAKWINTPLGAMIALADSRGLHLLEFVDRRGLERELVELRKRLGIAVVPGVNAHLRQTERELAAYFAGETGGFSVPVVATGSPFQQRVWDALRQIPRGQTRSYAAQAKMIGSPGAVRAVGRANGQNRIAIIIPCHRVVASDGTLCGYAGGLWRKQKLLELEGAIKAPSLFPGG